jgi:hypothetical protein
MSGEAWSLDAIVEGQEAAPPRVVIYGPHGIGKTTFGAGFPSPILLRTEQGLGSLSIPRFPNIARSYDEVIRAMGSLLSGTHRHESFLFDSLDWFEPLVWAETCRRHEMSSIESFDYGKGYTHADEVWAEFFDGLDALHEERGMAIVLIAHSNVVRLNPPDSEPFDQYKLGVHKRASAMIQEWADVVGFAHLQKSVRSTDIGTKKNPKLLRRGISTGDRLLELEERPAWDAKNRYQLPPTMPFDSARFLDLVSQRYEAVTEYDDVPDDATASPSPTAG